MPVSSTHDDADAHDPEEAALRARGERAAHDEQPEADAADAEREAEEVEPADDVLRPRRPLRADRVRHRRRRNADPERVDARDDVAVVRRAPASGRCTGPSAASAATTTISRRDGIARGFPRDVLALEREHLDRLRQRVDRLVELQHDLARRRGEPLLERGALLLQRRVRERGRREHERDESRDDERALHRCGTPAYVDRCPKIGRDVAVAVEQHRHDDERRREARTRRRSRARTERLQERERRRADDEPAERVVEERGAREEPAVLLVDEQRRSRDEEAEGRSASRQYCEWSLPRTRPSSAAPASMSTCAHEPCATMWIIEFV